MDATQDLPVINNTEAQRFEAELGDDRAVANYHLKNNIIIFTHTEVPEVMEGKGVAGRLIKTALDAARVEHYQVVPLCPFVAAYIRRHPEYQDLVMPRFRYMVG
jgi:predicted GNAT family acetyltransferase